MPTFAHGKDSLVLIDEYDFSSYLNSVTASSEVDVPETTAFGDSTRTYIVGIENGMASAEGMFDGSSEASDEIFDAALGSATNKIVTLAFGSRAASSRVAIVDAQETSYELSSPFDSVVGASVEFQAAAKGVDFGFNLSGHAAITASGDSASVDNGTSSTNGGVAHLHVTANAHDSTSDYKVQHSADNSTWADLVTFTQVSASTVTSQRGEITGTVNRYLRAVSTLAGTGSTTRSVTFARR